MPEPRRTSIAPWIAAAVAGVVLLALVLVYLFWLRPDKADAHNGPAGGPAPAVGQLTPAESAAMNAAGTEMVNLVTFSRDNFDTDFQRALAGATGGLRTDVQGKRDSILQTITKGKFDLYGRLTHKALSDTVKHGYVVLVTINGYRSTAPDTPIQQNLAVTEINVDGKWLAVDVKNIGITA